MPRAAPKGRRCTICQHPQRPNIDLAIATGISRRLIAVRFKVSADAAWRHGRAHPRDPRRAGDEGAGARGRHAPDFARGRDWRCRSAEGDPRPPVRHVPGGRRSWRRESGDGDFRTLHESLSLTAKLTGELVPHTGVSITNVLLSPDFMRLRAELLRVLARYPEAREEVAAVFRRVGLQAATEMGAPGPKLIEAQPAHAA